MKEETYDQQYKRIVQACAEAGVTAAQTFANMGVDKPLSLYCVRPQRGQAEGYLTLVPVGDPVPAGAVPVTSALLHGGVPYSNYYSFVYQHARQAPLYASGFEGIAP